MSVQKEKRKGYARRSDIPSDILAALNAGTLETATLSESLAIDFALLLKNTFPKFSHATHRRMQEAAQEGVLSRYRLAAGLIYEEMGEKGIEVCLKHPSDTIRCFGCFIVGKKNSASLEQLFVLIKPFAADSHYGVRELAWLGVRQQVADDVEKALELLTPWVYEQDENIRRFACELTRPRGVWCAHIGLLKKKPEMALAIVQPLQSDKALYVRNSVANWLNDASKTQPDWVVTLCAQWKKESPVPETYYICKRALRSIRKKYGD